MASPTNTVVSFIKSCLSYFQKTVSEAKANESLNRVISEANELPILSKRENTCFNSEKQNNINKKEYFGFTKINNQSNVVKIFSKEWKYEPSKLQSPTSLSDTKLNDSHKKKISATEKIPSQKISLKKNNLKKYVKKESKKPGKLSVLKIPKSEIQAHKPVKKILNRNETPKKIFSEKQNNNTVKKEKKEFSKINNQTKDLERFSKQRISESIKLPSPTSLPGTMSNDSHKKKFLATDKKKPKKISITRNNRKTYVKRDSKKQRKFSVLKRSKFLSSSLSGIKVSKPVKKISIEKKAPEKIFQRSPNKPIRDSHGRFESPNITKDITPLKPSVQLVDFKLQNSPSSSSTPKKEIKTPKKTVSDKMPRKLFQRKSVKKPKNAYGRSEDSSTTKNIITLPKKLEVQLVEIKVENSPSTSVSGIRANELVKEISIEKKAPKNNFRKNALKQIRDSHGRFVRTNITKDINPLKSSVQLVDFKLQNSPSPSSTKIQTNGSVKNFSISNESPKNISKRNSVKETKNAYGRSKRSSTTKNLITLPKKLEVPLVDLKVENSPSTSVSKMQTNGSMKNFSTSNKTLKNIYNQKSKSDFAKNAFARFKNAKLPFEEFVRQFVDLKLQNSPSPNLSVTEEEILAFFELKMIEEYTSFCKNASVTEGGFKNSLDQKSQKSLPEDADSPLRQKFQSKGVKRPSTEPVRNLFINYEDAGSSLRKTHNQSKAVKRPSTQLIRELFDSKLPDCSVIFSVPAGKKKRRL